MTCESIHGLGTSGPTPWCTPRPRMAAWPSVPPPGTANNNAGGAEGTPLCRPKPLEPLLRLLPCLATDLQLLYHCLDTDVSLGQDGSCTGRTDVTMYEELFDYSLTRVQGCCREMYSVAPITREDGGTWPFRARSFMQLAAHASRHLSMDPWCSVSLPTRLQETVTALSINDLNTVFVETE